jgi:hypothetical protein
VTADDTRDAPPRVTEARYLVGVGGQRVPLELEEPLPAAAHDERGERDVGGEAVRDHEVVVDVLAPVGAVDALGCADCGDPQRRGVHSTRAGTARLDGGDPPSAVATAAVATSAAIAASAAATPRLAKRRCPGYFGRRPAVICGSFLGRCRCGGLRRT